MVRKRSAACAVVAMIFGVLVASTSAQADEGQFVAPGPPPPPPYETITAPPAAGYIWVPGHWYYRSTGWVWAAGYWNLAPYSGAVWVPGHWVWRAYGWVWVPGHWRGYAVVSPSQGYAFVPGPPPPPQIEAVVAPPFVGAVWVGGFWRWDGRWVWAAGRWAAGPWRGALWVSGRWARHPGGWAWIGGIGNRLSAPADRHPFHPATAVSSQTTGEY